jgi:hypothetical protein
MTPKQGAGRLKWNAGWFGVQVGSSCWLLIAGVGAAKQFPELAALMIGCFLVPNIFGTVLWLKRDRIEPYAAYQALLLVLLVATAAALLGADYLGVLGALDRRFQNPRDMYWILCLFPALMLALRYLNRRSSNDVSR